MQFAMCSQVIGNKQGTTHLTDSLHFGVEVVPLLSLAKKEGEHYHIIEKGFVIPTGNLNTMSHYLSMHAGMHFLLHVLASFRNEKACLLCSITRQNAAIGLYNTLAYVIS